MSLSSNSTISSLPSSLPTSANDDLRLTLSSTYRISITDGRVFLGTFACIDKEKNLVLINADEWRFEEGRWMDRYVGMIMVPWALVRTAECMLGSGPEGDMYT